MAPNNDITYREWAPNAISAHFFGEFSKRYPFLYMANPGSADMPTKQTTGTVCRTL